MSDLRFSRRFIAAMGLIKWCCAQVNLELGLLDAKNAKLIQQAAQEVIDGKLDSQFVVDIFQTGIGHFHQHECQRGDRQPGQRICRPASAEARNRSIPTIM